MLFTLFTKNWRLVLDALLLIAIIVAVFLWNPFEIFGNGLQLNQTANLVSNVRSIGQLVTAEYYGEVVASLDETSLNLLQEDPLLEKAEEIYLMLKKDAYDKYAWVVSSFSEASEDNRNQRAFEQLIDRAIEGARGGYYNNMDEWGIDVADAVLVYWAKYIARQNIDENKYSDNNNRSKLREIQLENLFREVRLRYETLPPERFYEYLNQGFETTANFTDIYSTLADTKPNQDSNKELAIIGRGWVKAGFDFGTLDERRFHYDKESGIIHLFGIQPEILDTDINPWFIPERQVPGFEILKAKKVNFQDATRVKTYCKRKLEMYAMEADIINQARANGEVAIQEFFSLLTGNDIHAVRFHTDVLRTVFTRVSLDSLVTIDEIPLIDSTYNNYLSSIHKMPDDETLVRHKKQLLQQFIANVKSMPFEFQEDTLAFNFFTRTLRTMLQDTFIDQQEFVTLEDSLRWHIAGAEVQPVSIADLWSSFERDTSQWKVVGDSLFWNFAADKNAPAQWRSFAQKVTSDSIPQLPESFQLTIDNDTLFIHHSDGELQEKIVADSSAWLVQDQSLLWKVNEWWKKDSALIPAQYEESRYWFEDSLAFINDYNALIDVLIERKYSIVETMLDSVEDINIDSDAFRATITELENAKGAEIGDVLKYDLVNDSTLYIYEIQNILSPAASAERLEKLYYNVIPNRDYMQMAIRNELFSIKADSLIDAAEFELTDQQHRETSAFFAFLYQQHEQYHDRHAIVKASELFRRGFSKESMQKAGKKIKKVISKITPSL